MRAVPDVSSATAHVQRILGKVQDQRTALAALQQKLVATTNTLDDALNKLDANGIERAITAFAASPHGGLILTAGGPALVNRELIVALAAQHKLPAVYFDRAFVTAGGLLSYGPDRPDLFRRAAGYVDRILKGEKPADMPVQAPTKYQLVINLKTAKTLGIDPSNSLLARADELIE
jgi:putative ABC transport system substrate-binding protein